MGAEARHVAVTGGAGQIAYSLLFKIANGDMFGKDQPVCLHILEVPSVLQALDGIRMELEDCAFPLLKGIVTGDDPWKVFDGVDCALLVGAKPRGPGMERKDLLCDNGKIFVEQGKALNDAARRDVKVLVIGNPCNTNCLIALNNAPKLNPKNFHAMTRLDQNRAAHQLAQKSGASISEVTNVTIWGNHSSTQVPDYFNARIRGAPAEEVITDSNWLKGEFSSTVQKRGGAIIASRGKSSAASAAQAVVDAVKDLENPTPKGQWFSSGVYSNNNPYGFAEHLVISFPIVSKGRWDYGIVQDVPLNETLKQRIAKSEEELLEERSYIERFLKVGASHG